LLDPSDENKFVLIDFGLSRSYLKKNGSHIDEEEDDKFYGNQVFASRRALNF